jgi:DNA-binding NarL/FixJ family response regulator
LAALALRHGDYERAAAMFDDSLLIKRERQDRWGVAAVLHHLGAIALEQGHFSAARARYEDSLLEWLELGDTFSVAMVLESFAALAHARGHSPRALRIIGAASVLRASMRMSRRSPVQQLRVQQLLQSAEDAVGRERAGLLIAEGRAMDLDAAIRHARSTDEASAKSESPLALPAQGQLVLLTPREREVAALLLRGLSNRHIAEELVITERTAETHVCRILSKLGLDSRAQIAAWIIDNGLMETTRVRIAS